jgi:hypothetical protein
MLPTATQTLMAEGIVKSLLPPLLEGPLTVRELGAAIVSALRTEAPNQDPWPLVSKSSCTGAEADRASTVFGLIQTQSSW